MSFQQAIRSSPAAVRDACLAGKQGMKGEHREQVDCANTRRFLGSFDLDIRRGSQHAKRLQAAGFDLPRQKIFLV